MNLGSNRASRGFHALAAFYLTKMQMTGSWIFTVFFNLPSERGCAGPQRDSSGH